MLIDPQSKERIIAEIFRVLEEIGLRVDNVELKTILKKTGCTEKANDRISIPRRLIEEIVETKKKNQADFH